MKVRVLIDMDDGASGIRAVNALDSAMREYNEKLRRADPSAEIDFEVLGIVRDAEVRAGVVTEEPEGRRWFSAAYRAQNGKIIPIGDETVLAEYAQKTVDDFSREDEEGPDYFLASRIIPPWVPVKQGGAVSGLPAETDAGERESGGDGRRADRENSDTAAERHERPEHDETQADEQESRDVPGRDAGRHGTTVAVKQEGAEPSGLLVSHLVVPEVADAYSEREDADQPEADADPVPEGAVDPSRHDEHEQEQGAKEQVPVELHTDDSTPDGRHTSMKQEGAGQ